MKRVLCLLALMCSAAVSSAQSMGTLTDDGVTMEVKAAVGVLDADESSLVFFFLPFQPTAAEVAKLQANDYFWVITNPSPDPQKWKACPFGKLKLGWDSAKEVGDAKKATVSLLANGIGGEGRGTTLNKLPGEVDVAILGAVKEGQDVTLTSKGSHTMTVGKPTTTAWDLKVKARVLALKKS